MPHTPGPWTIDVKQDYGRVEIIVDRFPDDEDVFVALCRVEDAPMLAQAPAMYELLKEMEWSDEDHLHYPVCPICRMYSEEMHPSGGHEPDCRLAAVLKAVEGGE